MVHSIFYRVTHVHRIVGRNRYRAKCPSQRWTCSTTLTPEFRVTPLTIEFKITA